LWGKVHKKEKPLSFSFILQISYLLPLVCFLLFGKKLFRVPPLLLIIYSAAFYLLLTYFEDIKDWVDRFQPLKGVYSNFYTFLEYTFFTLIIFFNISSRSLKKIIIALSIAFVVFQTVYFLTSKFGTLDTLAIGVETILVFGYIICFFYEQFRKQTSVSIYYHPCFWIAVGILIYLGGSFFFYIMANHMTKEEIKKYWEFTYIGEIIKNIFFSLALFLYAKAINEKRVNKKVLPNLDMI